MARCGMARCAGRPTGDGTSAVARETWHTWFRPLRAGEDSAARCHLPISATTRFGIRVELDS